MTSSQKRLICINCPKGCFITIMKKGNEYIVEGNFCELGRKFAINELENPARSVTTVVFIRGAKFPVLPVKTDKPVPFNKIFDIIKESKKIIIDAPVKKGAIIIKNVAGTNANLIAERSLDKVD